MTHDVRQHYLTYHVVRMVAHTLPRTTLGRGRRGAGRLGDALGIELVGVVLDEDLHGHLHRVAEARLRLPIELRGAHGRARR